MNKLTFVLDIDGVLTDGTYHYTKDGKVEKVFGPDDSDALKLIKDDIDIVFVSADYRGFPISEKRINDMGWELTEVKSKLRLKFIEEHFGAENTIYMGDSFQDAHILKAVKCGICPVDASPIAKKYADFVTQNGGGHRAVADAVFYIAEKFLNKTPEELIGLN